MLNSIRAKLTLWYIGILAIVFDAFAFATYTLYLRGLQDETKTNINEMAKNFVKTVNQLHFEAGTVDGVELEYLRYDAGDQCRSTPRRPDTRQDAPAGVDYVYTDDVSPFQEQARSMFLAWLAELAYGAPAPAPARSTADDDVIPLTRRPPALDVPPSTTGGFGNGEASRP